MRRLSRIEPPDVYLLGITVALVAVGVLLVFDASYAKTADLRAFGFDTWYLAKRQMIFAAIGLICMLCASRVSVDLLRKLAVPLMVLSFVLLTAVLLPGIGCKVNGARSWFKIGPISFQPAELAKLILVLYLAHALGGARVFARRARRRWAGPLWATAGIVGLVAAEHDLGSAALLAAVALVMFAAAGAKLRWLVPAGACGLVLVYVLMCNVPHCKERVDSWGDPWGHRYGKGYQIVHALIGFGTGGLTGVGLGEGRVKSYIPAASTDYIYATVAEETGLLGSLALLAGFVVFAYRGLDVARQCSSTHSSLIVIGVISAVTVQALVNLAVATNAIPATGLPLPFISYGGSSLVIMLTGVGLVLSVSRHLHAESDERELDEDSPDRRRNRRAHLPGHQHRAGALRGRAGYRAALRR